MTNRFLKTTAAIALLAGASAASAQSPNANDMNQGSQAPATQNSSSEPGGASATTPMDRDSGSGTQGGADRTDRGDRNAQGNDNNRNAQGNNAGKSQTTGQAASGGKQLTTEQRTKVTTVIKQQNVRPATNVNFAVSVGTRVPREVGFHPLPAELVTIYPDWRGYEFFLVGEQIVVVNPRTLEIVAVIDA